MTCLASSQLSKSLVCCVAIKICWSDASSVVLKQAFYFVQTSSSHARCRVPQFQVQSQIQIAGSTLQFKRPKQFKASLNLNMTRILRGSIGLFYSGRRIGLRREFINLSHQPHCTFTLRRLQINLPTSRAEMLNHLVKHGYINPRPIPALSSSLLRINFMDNNEVNMASDAQRVRVVRCAV